MNIFKSDISALIRKEKDLSKLHLLLIEYFARYSFPVVSNNLKKSCRRCTVYPISIYYGGKWFLIRGCTLNNNFKNSKRCAHMVPAKKCIFNQMVATPCSRVRLGMGRPQKTELFLCSRHATSHRVDLQANSCIRTAIKRHLHDSTFVTQSKFVIRFGSERVFHCVFHHYALLIKNRS
jgi:hypothetical protein